MKKDEEQIERISQTVVIIMFVVLIVMFALAFLL